MTLTIKHKLWGGYAIILALLIVVALVSYVNLLNVKNKIKTVVTDSQPKIIASLDLANQIHKGSSALAFYMLSADEGDKEAYLTSLDTVKNSIGTLQKIINETKDQLAIEKVQQISDLAIKLNSYKDTMFSLVSDTEKNLPAVKIAKKELEPLGVKMLQLATDVVLSAPDTEDPEEISELILTAHEIRYHWSMIMSNVRSYLAFRNAASIDNINLFKAGMKQLIEVLSEQEDSLSEEQIDALDEFIALEQRYYSTFDKAYALHSSEKWRTDAYLIRTELSPLLKQVENELDILISKQQFIILKTTNELQAEVVRAIGLLSLLVAIAIGIVLVISYFSSTRIITPLRNAVTAMQNVASEDGDLTKRLDGTGKDEIGSLSTAFNEFIIKIMTLVRSIAFVGDNVKSSTVKLSTVAKNTKNQMLQLQAETHQVASAVTEMSATVHEVASSATATATATKEAHSEANKGSLVVSETIDVINTLHSQFANSSDEIKRLNSECDNITNVIDVIREIAETTNLLSLNAAIEAARAGEAGRGFAVVADEVRSLATRTQNSVLEIQKSIERLQVDSRSAVEAMDQGGHQVDICVEKAAEAGRTLTKITEVVSTINEMNTQVASAAEQQNAVFSEIRLNIEHMRTSSDEISKEGITTANEGSHLEVLSEELVKLVALFSLGRQ